MIGEQLKRDHGNYRVQQLLDLWNLDPGIIDIVVPVGGGDNVSASGLGFYSIAQCLPIGIIIRAKHNYELALKMRDEQQQQQEQEDQQDEQQQDEDQEQQEQEDEGEQQPTPTPSQGDGVGPTPTPNPNQPLFAALERAEAEAREVLELGLHRAEHANRRILIGVLKTDAEEARQCVVDTVAWLRERTGIADDQEAMLKARVCGFTVCPPKGEHLSQGEIRDALSQILDLGLPVALYQLPQVTQNEMSPDTVVELAERFPNFCLFKDSSGTDAIAQAGPGRSISLSMHPRTTGAQARTESIERCPAWIRAGHTAHRA